MTPTDLASPISIGLPLLITLSYLVTCWLWPFKACRTCRGAGKLRAPFGRALRYCPACRHTGLRLRAGRKAYNALHQLSRNNRR